jgi:hypothetical protein
MTRTRQCLICKEIAGWAVRRAFVGASEEMVFTAERDRPDRALDGIVVELDAAVIDKAAEGLPAREGVADCFSKSAAAWYPRKLGL